MDNSNIIDYNNLKIDSNINYIKDFIKSYENPAQFINTPECSKNMQKALNFFKSPSSDLSSNSDSELLNKVLFKIFPFITEIMQGQYSNYFFQKFVSLLSERNIYKILKGHVFNNIINVSTNDYSNRCVQALLNKIPSEKTQIKVFSKIYPYLENLSLNRYGTHVVQKIISKFSPKIISKLKQFIYMNYNMLSSDPNGVCVIKKYIIYIQSFNTKAQGEFIDFLEPYLERTIIDKYGVFVIVTMFEQFGIAYCKHIVDYIGVNITKYSLLENSVRLIHMILDSNECFVS